MNILNGQQESLSRQLLHGSGGGGGGRHKSSPFRQLDRDPAIPATPFHARPINEAIAALQKEAVTWAILPAALDSAARSLAAGGVAAPPAMRTFAEGGVVILPLRGPLTHRRTFMSDFFGATTYDILRRALAEAVADATVGTIILDIDSPGGSTHGLQETGDAVYAARKKKKVIALVNPLCASAAYWIASQAGEIIAVPSADIGSVGVFMLHFDHSGMMADMGVKATFIFAGEHKVEGNAFEPLSDGAKEYLQGEVNGVYRNFLKTVARGRGVAVADVEKNYGQGRTLMAADAVSVGMIDQVATFEAVLAGAASRPARAQASSSIRSPAAARARRLRLAAAI